MNDDLYDGGPDDEAEEMDIADEVSLADTGRPWGARAFSHPSMRPTAKHLAEHPLPVQQDRRSA